VSKFKSRAEKVIGLQLQGVLTKEAWDKHVDDVAKEFELLETEMINQKEKKFEDMQGSRDWWKRDYEELYGVIRESTGLYSHIGWIKDRLIPHLEWLKEQQMKVGPLETFKSRIERERERLIMVLDGENPDDD
jgi:hypothetical protein